MVTMVTMVYINTCTPLGNSSIVNAGGTTSASQRRDAVSNLTSSLSLSEMMIPEAPLRKQRLFGQPAVSQTQSMATQSIYDKTTMIAFNRLFRV